LCPLTGPRSLSCSASASKRLSPELLELLNSLNSSLCHGSLADLEPSKDRTVCLYRERMQESDGRRPF
jgi:hypothetical protein